MIFVRLSELPLGEVADPRGRRGRRWKLPELLTSLVVGMMAGCKSLAEVEALTMEMSPIMRRRLGIRRRVPDTTLHDTVCRLEPNELRGVIHAEVKSAYRRKALPPEGLPFHAAALDGKFVQSTEPNDPYVQGQPAVGDRKAYGSVRTVTATLFTSAARVCLDAIAIPAGTNEMGHFKMALKQLVEAYGTALFRLITYDAGACSHHNAQAVIDAGLNYLFGLKGPQGHLHDVTKYVFEEMKREPLAETRDALSEDRVVIRRLWLWRKGASEFPGLQTIPLVQSSVVDRDGQVLLNKKGEPQIENRYFVSSLDADQLTPAQWLLLVRGHWRVENDCHKTWDVSFEEDDRRWIPSNPKAMVVILLLRRIAYNMLALFRSVTQRGAQRRGTPWKDLLRWVNQTLIASTEQQIDGLRHRPPAAVYSY